MLRLDAEPKKTRMRLLHRCCCATRRTAPGESQATSTASQGRQEDIRPARTDFGTPEQELIHQHKTRKTVLWTPPPIEAGPVPSLGLQSNTPEPVLRHRRQSRKSVISTPLATSTVKEAGTELASILAMFDKSLECLMEDFSGGKEPNGLGIVREPSALAPPQFEYISESRKPTALGPAWVLPAELRTGYTKTGRLSAFCAGEQHNWPPNAPMFLIESGDQRVVRAGAHGGLEIFWVGQGTGWGVRTRSPLAPGEFVCEYAGEVLNDSDAEAKCSSTVGRDAYLFDLTTPSYWDFLNARRPAGSEGEDPQAFVIDAFAFGNVGRLLNHACGPSSGANIIPVFAFTEDDVGAPLDARLPRVAFFANRAVNVGEELRYDYGTRPGDVVDPNGTARALVCHCGSSTCRGRVY